MADDGIVIRTATRRDLPAVGRLGAELVRVHVGFDRHRFLNPDGDVAEGYAWFLGTQLARSDATVLVAEDDGRLAGYVYTAVEPLSWEELRDEAGFIHDIIVDDEARGRGVGALLIEAAVAWLRERGMPRVILWTAERNAPAHEFFARRGFRRTMIEMTREIDQASAREDRT